MKEITLEQICNNIAINLEFTGTLAKLLSNGDITPQEMINYYAPNRLCSAHFDVALDLMKHGSAYRDWTPDLIREVQASFTRLEQTMLTW